MIIDFKIKNFGSIKDLQTLSFLAEKSKHLEDFYVTKIGKFRLLKIALIYGANASGKTMILKALDFLRNLVLKPKEKKTERLNFTPFLFDEKTRKENTHLSIEFIQNDIKYSYKVEFCERAIINESLFFYNPKKSEIFKRKTDLKSQFTDIKFGSKIKINKIALETLKANTLWNNTVLGGYLKTNIEIKELKEVLYWFENYLHSLVYPESKLDELVTSLIDNNKIKKDNILDILKKADLYISDIVIEKKEIKEIKEFFLVSNLMNYFEYVSEDLYGQLKIKNKKPDIKLENINLEFEHLVEGKRYKLPYSLESQGTKRYYGFAGLLSLLLKKSTAFPIDELEASLHPDLFLHFLLSFLANSKRSQIIATTHNREILNDKDIIRDDAIWITNKMRNAATELYSFADFDSSVIRDTTNRLNAYKSGKLGGIPNIGDYYLDLD